MLFKCLFNHRKPFQGPQKSPFRGVHKDPTCEHLTPCLRARTVTSAGCKGETTRDTVGVETCAFNQNQGEKKKQYKKFKVERSQYGTQYQHLSKWDKRSWSNYQYYSCSDCQSGSQEPCFQTLPETWKPGLKRSFPCPHQGLGMQGFH